MSKDYFLFEQETGAVAYMAGVIDVLSDELSGILDFSNTMTADIFPLQNQDISFLEETVKKRLTTYCEKECIKISNAELENFYLKLELVQTDAKQYFLQAIAEYSSAENKEEKITAFLSDLNWYLQKPVCIYQPEKYDKTYDIIGKIYLYIAYQYFFIIYQEWAVLIVIGTIE